jgi:hypothetical protein
MWKSLFLKRFFSAVSFFANSFLPYFFGNGDVEEFVSETDFFAVYMFFRKCFFAVFDFFRLETGRLVFLLCVLFLPWDGATQTIAVGIF